MWSINNHSWSLGAQCIRTTKYSKCNGLVIALAPRVAPRVVACLFNLVGVHGATRVLTREDREKDIDDVD